MHILHTRFCTFGTDLYAQSVLSNKISASEISQKFIKSALLVGKRCRRRGREKKGELGKRMRLFGIKSWPSEEFRKKKEVVVDKVG